MHGRQKRSNHGFKGILGFINAHRDVLGDLPATGAAKRLALVVEQLEELAIRQDPGGVASAEATDTVRKLRHAIQSRWMHPVSKIARAQLDGPGPELRNLRVPASGINMETFVIAARNMVTNAALYGDIFIDAALPSDFVARFTTAIDALEDAIAQRTRAHGERVGATRELAHQISLGLRAVRILDAIITPEIESSEELLGDWRTMMAAMRRRGRARASQPVTDTAAPTEDAT